MPTQKHVNEIAEIITLIQSGHYLHEQKNYHTQMSCGTAHCIAGWKVIRDYGRDPGDYDNYGCSERLESFMEYIANTDDEWGYAKNQWELSMSDAARIFDNHLSIEDIKLGLNRICKRYSLINPLPLNTAK